MRKKSLYLWGTAALAVVLIVLLPVFLSSGWLQQIFLSRLNSSIPGTLTVADCSIGWQQGLQCSGVVYTDRQKNVSVTAPRLRGSQGLFALLVAHMNLGTITLTKPVVVLSAAAPVSSPSSTHPVVKKTAQGKSAPPLPKASAGVQNSSPWWDRLIAKIVVKDAVVQRATGAVPGKTFIRKGSLNGRLAEGTLHFDLAIESEREQGKATATGFVNLPAHRGAFLDTLVTEVNLHVMALQLEPFLALVPGAVYMPRGKGELSTEVLVKISGIDKVMAHGTARLRNLELSGGVLGRDKPAFKQLNFDIDVKRGGKGNWQFPVLTLSADFGLLELQGAASDKKMSLEGEGSLILPVLLAQFPHLLKVQEGTSLQDGVMDVSLMMTRDSQRTDVAVDAEIRNISGSRQGNPFAWNSPVDCSFSGALVNGDPMLNSLKIKAPFLDLQGKGDLKTFSLQGTADLAGTVEEVGTLFDLGWEGSGQIQLSVASKEEIPGRYLIDSWINATDLTLSRRGKPVMPSHSFSFKGQLKTPPRLPASSKEAAELTVDVSAWPGTLSGTLSGLFRQQDRLTAGFQLDTDLHLGRLSDVLHNADLLPETTLSGRMDLQAAGYLEKQTVVLRQLNSRISDCIFYHQGMMFRDPLVRLKSSETAVKSDAAEMVHPLVTVGEHPAVYFAHGGDNTMLNPASHRIQLRKLQVFTEKGSLDIGQLAVDDWRRLPASLVIQAKGTADLARLTPELRRYGLLSDQQALGGDTSFSISLQKGKDGQQAGNVAVEIDRGSAEINGREIWHDQQLAASVAFQGNLQTRDLVVESCNLQTAPLQLQGKGRIENSAKAPFFSCSGEMTPDFAALAELLQDTADQDIRGRGGKREPFTLFVPLAEKNSQGLEFSTKVQGDSLSAFGVQLDQFTMPLNMADGKLEADLTAAANGGTLNLSPRIDYTLVPPEATLPEGEQVLADVEIKRPLAEGLLKRLNPLFGLLAKPSGTISARMDNFSWPLAENGSRLAEFSTVLSVGKIHLVPEGALLEILALTGLDKEPLTLRQSEMSCNGKEGRISCTPLEIMVAGSEMTLAGSIGFDGSIDYLLKVPVTEQLVGREGYRVLKDTTLEVPLRGDSGGAVFDRNALAAAVADLLVQAGGKEVGKVLQEQAEKALPGLIDGLLGK